MTRSPSSALISELQNPSSPIKLNAALVALKNELIGHEQRKKVWIGYGIVPILARILEQRRGDTGKNKKDTNGETSGMESRLTEDDTACLHATVIAGNIAQAGSAFVAPLLAGGIIPRLITILSTSTCPLQLTIGILKTLNTIADRLPPQYPNDWPVDRQLASTLYSKEHIGVLSSILGQSSALSSVQLAIALTARLISKTCTEEVYKVALVKAGILDALAVRLASFVVSQGFVLPGAEGYVHEPGSLGSLPPSAPPKAQLSPIIQCISIIIENSSTRTQHLLASPAIVTVFPRARPEFSSVDIRKPAWSGSSTSYLSGAAVPQYAVTNPIDQLLPVVPGTVHLHANISFPPLGNKFYSRNSSFMSLDFEENSGSVEGNDEDESAIVSWLMFLIREDKSVVVRLRASKILINLFRLGFVMKQRLPMLSMILMPLLVGMLDSNVDLPGPGDETDVLPLQLRVKEELPHLLANLVMDSPELQKSAVDAHAIKRLSDLLKKTFDPLPDHAKGMWSPEKKVASPRNRPEPEMSLGMSGPTPMARHLMRFREGLLMALAALAPFKDEYRKAICDQGVIPFIVDSLKPYTTVPHLSENGPNGPHMIPGNPTPTLLAACNAARALTRSVSVLRTSLNDANIGPPIFTLLKNKDVEVQVAATRVVCNLALDFSPMKEAVVSHGVLKTLCEHAHSAHARLRLESIWALKHLVYNSSNEVKIKVLEELGVGWMTTVIQADQPSDEKGTGIDDFGRISFSSLGNINALGEPINLLNPKEESSEDVSMTEEPINQGLENFKAHAAERRRAAIEAADQQQHSSIINAQKSTIAIQEQLLELIRNIICGNGASEMIDYLFREIGQADLFTLLLDKLRPSKRSSMTTITTPPATRSRPIPKSHSPTIATTINPYSSPTTLPTEILIATTYILVHLAASHPQHRRILTTQSEILRALIPLFDHPSRVIRVNCCWITINLTYTDDPADKISCRHRARELEKMGVMEKLAGLMEDEDLDVRERTKTAVSIMGGLLGREC